MKVHSYREKQVFETQKSDRCPFHSTCNGDVLQQYFSLFETYCVSPAVYLVYRDYLDGTSFERFRQTDMVLRLWRRLTRDQQRHLQRCQVDLSCSGSWLWNPTIKKCGNTLGKKYSEYHTRFLVQVKKML